MSRIISKFFHVMKSRILYLILGICLAGFICILSGLDAPEYTRCTHIGVCEFLDICEVLGDSQKSKMLIDNIGRFSDKNAHNASSLIYLGWFPPFIVLLKTIAATVDYIQNLGLSDMLSIKDRCIQPSYEIFASLLAQNEEVLNDKKQKFFSSQSSSPLQAFQIITTTIMRC